MTSCAGDAREYSKLGGWGVAFFFGRMGFFVCLDEGRAFFGFGKAYCSLITGSCWPKPGPNIGEKVFTSVFGSTLLSIHSYFVLILLLLNSFYLFP